MGCCRYDSAKVAGQATDGTAPMYIPNPPARKMADFVSQLDASVVVDGSAATDVEGVEEALLAAHLATYMEGGNPSYLVTDPKTAGVVSAMAMAAGRNRDIRNERKIVNVIDLYVSLTVSWTLCWIATCRKAPCCWLISTTPLRLYCDPRLTGRWLRSVTLISVKSFGRRVRCAQL